MNIFDRKVILFDEQEEETLEDEILEDEEAGESLEYEIHTWWQDSWYFKIVQNGLKLVVPPYITKDQTDRYSSTERYECRVTNASSREDTLRAAKAYLAYAHKEAEILRRNLEAGKLEIEKVRL